MRYLTDLEIALIAVLWVISGICLWRKQAKADPNGEANRKWVGGGNPDITWFFSCFIGAPLFLVGTIIRQVFIEDWK